MGDVFQEPERNLIAFFEGKPDVPETVAGFGEFDDVEDEDEFVHEPEFGLFGEEAFEVLLSAVLILVAPDVHDFVVHSFVGRQTQQEVIHSLGNLLLL